MNWGENEFEKAGSGFKKTDTNTKTKWLKKVWKIGISVNPARFGLRERILQFSQLFRKIHNFAIDVFINVFPTYCPPMTFIVSLRPQTQISVASVSWFSSGNILSQEMSPPQPIIEQHPSPSEATPENVPAGPDGSLEWGCKATVVSSALRNRDITVL